MEAIATYETIRARAMQLVQERYPGAVAAVIGGGKHLFRRLHAYDPVIAAQLDSAQRLLASDLPLGQQIYAQVTSAILAPAGGPLLEGYDLPAPAHWRSS